MMGLEVVSYTANMMLQCFYFFEEEKIKVYIILYPKSS